MSNKNIILILTLGALLSFVAVRAATDHNIIIDNKSVSISEIDSITFSADANSAYQTVWKDGTSTSSEISSGQQTFILPYSINDSIYSLGSDNDWTKIYLTPVGFFFYKDAESNYLFYFEGDEASVNGGVNGGHHDLWYYESFDGSSSAYLLFAKRKNIFTVFEHNNGQVTAYAVEDDNNLELTHIVGENKRFSDIPVTLDVDIEDYSDIHNILKGVNLQYRDYRPDDYDPEFVRLLQLFESLLDVPVADQVLPISQTVKDKKSQATDKIKKKKFHSSVFTIRFETTDVAFPQSAHRATLLFHSDEFKCASSLAIEKVEYWYILDENPDSLTIEKADNKYRITEFSVAPYDYFIYFSDLKPGKKYYYTSCVRIPKDQAGSYVFKFGDRNATVKYGETYSVETMKEYRLEVKSSHTSVGDFSVDLDASGEIGNFTAISDKENIIWMKDEKGWLSKYDNNFCYLKKGKTDWEVQIRPTYFNCPICGWKDKYGCGNSGWYFHFRKDEGFSMLLFLLFHEDGLYDDDCNYVKSYKHGGPTYVASSRLHLTFNHLSSSWETAGIYSALNYYYSKGTNGLADKYYGINASKKDSDSEGTFSRTPGYSDVILPPLLPEQFQIRVVRVYDETTIHPFD